MEAQRINNTPVSSGTNFLTQSSNIQDFSFLGNGIRVVIKDENPWFVLADVAKTLNLTNPSMIVQTLRENQRAKFDLGRQGNATIINDYSKK